MNFKKKLQLFLALLLVIMPFSTLAYSDYVILGGQNVGIEVKAKNITVAGFYKVNNNYIAKESGIKIGDKIIAIEDIEVTTTQEMIEAIHQKAKEKKINITVQRANETEIISLPLIKENDNYKTGIYVKDQVTGLGTLTYIDPESKIFGALGHEIIDASTTQKLEIKTGKIFTSEVTGATKSTETTTGEKNAVFHTNDILGTIKKNTISGIFGNYQAELEETNLIEVATKDEIKLGKASILTVLENDKIQSYDISILKINKEGNTKNILFEITDEELIKKTNGVIKGMSGSPIIQNNKLIGAVTHAIINDNNKGYGIFITTMLEEGEK